MDGKKAWIAPLGVCLVCLMLAAGLGSAPEVALVLTVLAGVAAVVAAHAAVRGRLGTNLRGLSDPYDLGKLRALEEQLQMDALDPGEVSEDADRIVCVRCGTAYRTRMPVCPNCRHMQ